MDKSTIFAGLFGIIATVPATAASLPYGAAQISGHLDSYQLSYPGLAAPALEGLDPTSPMLISEGSGLSAVYDSSNTIRLSLILQTNYHAVGIFVPSLAGTTKTYAQLTQELAGSGINYDAITKIASGTINLTSSTSGLGSYCMGSVSLCGGLYSEEKPGDPNYPWTPVVGSTANVNIQFGDAFNHVVFGTIVVKSQLSNGGYISRTYEISDVPLPMSGVLFGSTILAMVGMRQRSKQS